MTKKELIQLLRDNRPDPFTVKASFLRGYDAAIAELEKRRP